jgi:hypothetical protein
VRSDGSDPTVTVHLSELSVPCDSDLTAEEETVVTHRREASTARSSGSGNHDEVAAAVPSGDEVLDDAQEVTA